MNSPAENKGFSILIADDQPANLGVLSGMLREHGYHVRAVTNGRKALDAARAQPPDLIMLDISMPEMDGFQACRGLKADAALAQIPVIFISAHDQPLDKVEAFRSGGADYVTKPFQLEEVLARLENQLRILCLQRELIDQNDVLIDAFTKLQEIDRIKASFAAMLVHDLKSPLTVMRSVLWEVMEGVAVDRKLLEMCDAQVNKSVEFLNDLLEVFNTEVQGITLQNESLDIQPMLEGVVKVFDIQAVQQGVSLHLVPDGQLPCVRGDRSKLERVFINLVTNALKFTPRSGNVFIRADHCQGEGLESDLHWLRVAVEDTGRGIPADQVPFVFEPYRQVFAGDAAKGSGLGLAIVARIVAAHRGRVNVQSREGIGSRFTVLLPVE